MQTGGGTAEGLDATRSERRSAFESFSKEKIKFDSLCPSSRSISHPLNYLLGRSLSSLDSSKSGGRVFRSERGAGRRNDELGN